MDGDVGLADVPLGPFEGTVVTVYTTSSRQAKLHVSTRCGYLRSREPAAVQVRLEAGVMGRLCPSCGNRGPRPRPGTGADLFFHALGGVGLLYQLRAYTGPDGEDFDREEITAAAALLAPGPAAHAGAAPGDSDLMAADRALDHGPDQAGEEDPDEDEEEDEQLREDARALREAVLTTWQDAAQSLHHAGMVISSFPWLKQWAAQLLARKQAYLAVLQEDAARFVACEQLLAAAAAAVMETPQLPVGDAAFSILGTQGDAEQALESLWHTWRASAASGWEPPPERAFLVYDLMHRRRGPKAAQALERARQLLAGWEEQARHAAATAPAGSLELTVTLPPSQEDEDRHRPRTGWDSLDRWALGVLVTCTADVDWAAGTARLLVPSLIANRLMAPGSPLPCTSAPATADPGTPHKAATRAGRAPLAAGIFDDTPVADRLPVTADHLQALTAAWAGADQLYIVFSVEGGVETLPLPALRDRCARGWQGVILAGASDLPSHLFAPDPERTGSTPEKNTEENTGPGAGPGAGAGGDGDGEPLWQARTHSPFHERFAVHLGLEDGQDDLTRMAMSTREADANLRAWAMARGVPDLRTLGGDDRYGRPARTVPYAAWNALLAMDTLDLDPFSAPDDTHLRSGSAIPLAVLADVQIYTTNADPFVQGKGHSPACGHARDRGVGPHYDLLTAAQVLVRPDIDWCGKCGGYAVRRLTGQQLAYYRAAHRLHHLATTLAPEAPPTRYALDTAQLVSRLEALADAPRELTTLHTADGWRWHGIVRPLLTKARRWHQAAG